MPTAGRGYSRGNLASKQCIPIMFRNTWICVAIERGVPLPIIAELVGNSVEVLIKHYVHMAGKKDALKAAALKAVSA
jgi:hypothetical protein